MQEDKTIKFKAPIHIIGINPFVFVPPKILKAIFTEAGKDKGHIPITGTINAKPYKQTLVRYSGEWRLYINTTMLKNSPKRIGEQVEITVAFDSERRDIKMPPAFAKALKANKEAALTFEKLTASRKKEIVRYLANLKTTESLDRNIIKAINSLTGKEKFAGRENIKPAAEKAMAPQAWHVVQQKKGSVKPTIQSSSAATINDDAGLEHEADVMGAKATDSLKKRERNKN